MTAMPPKPAAIDDSDYSTGNPRRHHSLYISDGNLALQVENAIFKIHRSFLERYSVVIKDMLGAPPVNGQAEGTEENPLVLTGDSAVGWESLLGRQYASPRFYSHDVNEGNLLPVLAIAHKYCMETIEEDILRQLNNASTTAGYVDLLVAAQVVGSKPLYDQALKSLISSSPRPSLEQARRIGIDAHYAIIDGVISAMSAANDAALVNVDNKKCRHCAYNLTNWECFICHQRKA